MMARQIFGMPALLLSLMVTLRPAAAQGRGAGETEGVGAIKGSVLFKGVRPHLPQISMTQDPVCASLQTGPVYPEDGQVNANGTLPNAFLSVKAGPVHASYPPPSTPVILNQVRCEYEPHVLGIMVGQPLKVLNSDPTTHNVHIMPKYNRPWNVSQEPGSQPFTRRFRHPEIMIPVRCNHHPWMKAYIGVTTNPFYAVTGKAGTFAIGNLPPGRYTLEVRTATFGTQEKQVTVESGRTSTVDFTFGSQ
jgi:plastocyanin